MLPFIQRAYGLLITVGNYFQPLLLLAFRLYWGWQFHITGLGKLRNIDGTTQFFEGLHIPFPKFNVYLAAGTECIGGLLLMAGLASRLVSIPLIFTMLVAYATADAAKGSLIFKDPDKFLETTPLTFLMVGLVVFAFGAGVFSLDWLIGRKFKPAAKRP